MAVTSYTLPKEVACATSFGIFLLLGRDKFLTLENLKIRKLRSGRNQLEKLGESRRDSDGSDKWDKLRKGVGGFGRKRKSSEEEKKGF